MTCPCGRGETLEACCGPVLGGAAAQTAEDLMRSRYTAYTLGNIDHVVATHDPATRDTVDRAASEAWSKQSTWLGLDVLATEAGGAADETGMVEFVAKFTLAGRVQQHHERSRFRKEDGHWYYVDGDVQKARPVERDAPKVGRNEPCPCGSGKKFKKCHGQA
jgi:SEC-C motif-containing protein